MHDAKYGYFVIISLRLWWQFNSRKSFWNFCFCIRNSFLIVDESKICKLSTHDFFIWWPDTLSYSEQETYFVRKWKQQQTQNDSSVHKRLFFTSVARFVPRLQNQRVYFEEYIIQFRATLIMRSFHPHRRSHFLPVELAWYSVMM